MTITVCVGPSGSGKTTFMEDVHKTHKCTYIRQYHSIRPYITVSKIPNFDPTQLPFWDTYVKEGKADTIQAGGTLAGKFTAGFSGGQRKLLLFELIYQRTQGYENMLICLDEPFSGVTDDFVPFFKQRLKALGEKHNILLVTNDHVDLLKEMADNIITVSSIDRSVVKLNDQEGVDREKLIIALAVGESYKYDSVDAGLKFFWDVEVVSNGDLRQIFIFATCVFALYLATFWDSSPTSAPLVVIAGGIMAFFSLQPFLLSQVEWRNNMLEETEALLHSSVQLNRALKVLMCLILIFLLTAVEFGVVNAVIDKLFAEAKYWVAMLCDSASLTLPLVCLGIYSRLPFQTVQLVGSIPFLGMLFFSTTFSPGAGVPVLKELRYLYPRFYFFCMVPGVQQEMEGCPSDDVIVPYMILSTFTGIFLLFTVIAFVKLRHHMKEKKRTKTQECIKVEDETYREIQMKLYGRWLGKDTLSSSNLISVEDMV
jgi:ABC-type nitrate/sulfonate/bicarbonate transport system ATPase subunit